ncbi:MAG: chemotaxis protein CheB [Gemmataceae bacterium]
MSENVTRPETPMIESAETPEPSTPRDPFYIVGIGASAGGLEALERLFENMPANMGMAFVVVQHLSPDFKSLMDELLARKTKIPIFRVEHSMQVQADAIYLIPPKKDMIIVNGRLLLTDKDPKQPVALPIDLFFRSLAQEAGEHAVGIILSGTGSDGSRGIREIHEVGGLVIVQDPETAKFNGMPNSAIQTGAVDLVLAPEKIPDALTKFAKRVLWKDKADEDHLEILSETALETIFRLLRNAYRIDFSHYKLTTVGRRIDRRMLLNHIVSLDDYVQKLREDMGELNALYKDLLIGVTRFFRDNEAFERLGRDILPELLLKLAPGEDFRAWSVGCATGEEAYSLAILIHEGIERLGRPINVKIFATDVHRASLDAASAGIYSEVQLADTSQERLERFFIRKNGAYQIAPQLRQMVVFAQHNVIKDAPFTKLDLISCRNMLIYLQPPYQKKVLSLFHFALKTGGILFQGPSETPGELIDEFTPVDNHWKIYRKRRDIRLSPEMRQPLTATVPPRLPTERLATTAVTSPSPDLVGLYDALLDAFVPSSLLVNENLELVQVFGDANRYLRMKKGRLSKNILDMVDADLKTVLSGALAQVRLEKTPVSYKGLRVRFAEGERLVNLTINPFLNPRHHAFFSLIILEEQGGAPPPLSASEVNIRQASREQIESLETELRYTKENLQATIEEMETSNEELQATNEELVASNEELQSTNEELHSVNEELYTVNAEYQKKITELTELTADMDNLLESTQVHTLFLDRNRCIRKFTPRMAETFNLLPQDIGRRIDTFTTSIDCPTLMNDILKVMESGDIIERQVQDHHQRHYMLRILPYRAKNPIDGVVLTLIDLTNLKCAEAEARRKDAQLSNILNYSPHLVFIKDLQGRYQVVDEAFKKLAGYEPVGKTAYDIFPQETADALARVDRQALGEGKAVEAEVVIPRPDGPHTYLAVVFPYREDNRQILGICGIATDVTRLKHAERQAREAVEQRDRFLAMLSHELRNPLGAIISAVGVLERDSASPLEHQESLHVLQRQADQMSRLLDDLLDVSRITQDKIYLRKELVNLQEVIDEAVRVVRPIVAQQSLTLDLEKNVGDLSIIGDSTRLQQMMVNLLKNAVKYTPSGGRITLRLDQENGQVVIRIKDTGMGISPTMLEKVFDLFVQANDTLDRSHGGLGVGLTLVKAIAQLHGGAVQAYSQGPGTGCEFIIRLPVGKTGEMTGGRAASAEPAPAVDAVPVSRKVVLIEDNDDSRRMLESLLKMDGVDVRAVRDGKEGLETILSFRPGLAFVDIGLPGLSGYQVAQEVRSRLGQEVYLVALTGYGRPEDRLAVLKAGFDEHLVKPLKRRDLERVFQQVQERNPFSVH